jgi:hypothetical protein
VDIGAVEFTPSVDGPLSDRRANSLVVPTARTRTLFVRGLDTNGRNSEPVGDQSNLVTDMCFVDTDYVLLANCTPDTTDRVNAMDVPRTTRLPILVFDDFESTLKEIAGDIGEAWN